MIYQYGTSNKSFLETANELKQSGVSNHQFMLALKNERLAEIDPWDEKLTLNQKIDIVNECNANFWYFIREIIRWPFTKDGKEIIARETKLEQGNCAMYWCSLNRISSWRTTIRQSCSDLSVNSLGLWMLLFKSNFTGSVISHDWNTAKDQLRLINEIRYLVPPSLNEIFWELGYNSERMINKRANAKLTALRNPHGNEQAENVGRGSSFDIQFFHLPEFQQYLEPLMLNRAPILNSGKEPRINIFSGPYAEDPGNFVLDLIEGMMKWQNRFYDYDVDRLQNAVMKYSIGTIYIKHYYNQLRYDGKWFEEHSRLMGGDNSCIINRELIPRRR